MKYIFNCKNCINRVEIADKDGFFHGFCKLIREGKKRPIHYSRLKQEISCEEYRREEDGQK